MGYFVYEKTYTLVGGGGNVVSPSLDDSISGDLEDICIRDIELLSAESESQNSFLYFNGRVLVAICLERKMPKEYLSGMPYVTRIILQTQPRNRRVPREIKKLLDRSGFKLLP
jgi:hypothetical protein